MNDTKIINPEVMQATTKQYLEYIKPVYSAYLKKVGLTDGAYLLDEVREELIKWINEQ